MSSSRSSIFLLSSKSNDTDAICNLDINTGCGGLLRKALQDASGMFACCQMRCQTLFQDRIAKAIFAADDDRMEADLDQLVVAVEGAEPDDALPDLRCCPCRLFRSHMKDEIAETVEDRTPAIDL